MSPDARLVADIGGTRARFALLDRTGSPGLVRILAVSDFPGPVEAIQAYLEEVGAPALQAAAIALAAPVHGEVIRLTNAAWTFSRDQLKSRLGLRRVLLLNDFTPWPCRCRTLAPQICVRLAPAPRSNWLRRRCSGQEPAWVSPGCCFIAGTGWR
jgi:glucokinase